MSLIVVSVHCRSGQPSSYRANKEENADTISALVPYLSST